MAPVLDPTGSLDEIKAQIFSFADAGVVKTSNGSTFIAPLQAGPLFFLNKIFLGSSDQEIQEIQRLVGFPLPSGYEQFMRFSNGALLFDNTLTLYGTRGNLAREVSLEAIAPPLLAPEIGEFRRSGGSPSTIPVGSIVGHRETFSLLLRQDGSFSITDESAHVKIFPCFLAGLLTGALLLAALSDQNGLLDKTGHDVEAKFRAFLGN